MSLKALANKVLERNSKGISEEYPEKKEGIFRGNNEGEIFHAFDSIDDGELKPLPFLDRDGSVIIPFRSDSRFHYWRGGQSIAKTEAEVKWKH